MCVRDPACSYEGKKVYENEVQKWLVFIISMSLAAVALAAAGPGYHVVTTYKVGGERGWDYLTTDAD